jgi:hypothetical protein
MTYEDEEFNRIERESRIRQEYVRTMYTAHHDCPKCAEYKEARNLWRKLALDLWDNQRKNDERSLVV